MWGTLLTTQLPKKGPWKNVHETTQFSPAKYWLSIILMFPAGCRISPPGARLCSPLLQLRNKVSLRQWSSDG